MTGKNHSPMNTLRPDTLLRQGSYRIIKVLGKGGFGITYLAVHTVLEKKVAIKEFFPKDFCNRDKDATTISLSTESNADLVEKLRKKFTTEARNLAKLNHPGIVRIEDIFEENNSAYFVMEFIDGEPLSEIVKRGPLTEKKAVKYITEVAVALEHLHSKRINHLDVKPANIMIRSDNDGAVLVDFGLAKEYDNAGSEVSTTPSGMSHGYAPPEQYRPGGVGEFSPKVDIYALGATLYKLLTGTTPPMATELIDAPLEMSAGISENIKKSILKAMSLNRKGRYDTVMEFVADLGNVKSMAKQSRAEEDETTELRLPASKAVEEDDNTDFQIPPQTASEGNAGIKKAHIGAAHQETLTSNKKKSQKTIFLILGILAVLVIVALAVVFSKPSGASDEPTVLDDSITTAVVDYTDEAATGNALPAQKASTGSKKAVDPQTAPMEQQPSEPEKAPEKPKKKKDGIDGAMGDIDDVFSACE